MFRPFYYRFWMKEISITDKTLNIYLQIIALFITTLFIYQNLKDVRIRKCIQTIRKCIQTIRKCIQTISIFF